MIPEEHLAYEERRHEHEGVRMDREAEELRSPV